VIPKGNQRGGGRQLATHLLNRFDNEKVEVAELRGAVARDLHGAFHEWFAHSKSTRAEKYLYSLSISPDLQNYDLTREQYLDFIARTERSLKLVGQPRAIVFHVKKGREHAHVVWSRIDVDAGKAVHMAHDRLKLRRVAQDFARDHGLPLPENMRPGKKKDRFNDKAKRSNLAERQQEERTGTSKAERMAAIREAWDKSVDGPSFVRALEERGYVLARGDKRGHVVIDRAGEVHSLSRQLGKDITAKMMRERLGPDYASDKLPDIETVRDRRKDAARENTPEPARDLETAPVDDRREKLEQSQAERRAPLADDREKTLARHAREREALTELHASENRGILSARAFRQPQGLRAFLMRITGFKMLIGLKHRREDTVRAKSQTAEMRALEDRHRRELKAIGRRDRALDAIDAREKFSLKTLLRREAFQKLIILPVRKPVQAQPLTPAFERAADPRLAATGTDGGSVRAVFNRLSGAFSLPKTFNRAADPAAPAQSADDPVNPRLELARRLRDELLRQQPTPGPNRDRER
jgi:Relaxase/Mobilisation nuclease domain